jgi:hypothetical protein
MLLIDIKMRKFLLFMLIVAFFSSARGNILMPQAWISEILVDSSGNWTIEMGFYEYGITDIDSVRLETSSGSSIISFYEVIYYGDCEPFDSLAVITASNLLFPLTINPAGDYVKLVSYTWDTEVIDEVAFGNYPGSFLDCILEGESVSCYEWKGVCIDSSPSIGQGNDGNGGRWGYFSGVILDPSGVPITSGWVNIETNTVITLYPDEQGFFNQAIMARRYTFDTILHKVPPYPPTVYAYTCEPVDFCIRPDSSFYHDIITTSLIIGLEEPNTVNENAVTIAPNPFSDHVEFYFNLGNDGYVGNLSLSIFTLDGKEVELIQLQPGQANYSWVPAGSVTSGTYIYRLENDKGIIKTGKFVKL